MSPRATPSYHILQYQYVPDILERRGPYRDGHLGAASKLEAEGKCVLAGAFGDPVEGGLFVMKNMSTQVKTGKLFLWHMMW
jgi:uncharacterized protein